MKNFFLSFLLALFAANLSAQTVIGLGKGSGVRAKTLDDYKTDYRSQERIKKDSAEYVDHLRRGLNALYADSLNEAEDHFNQALKQRPDAPGNHIVRYNLALIDIAREQAAKAVEKLTPIIKEYPAYYDARLARCEANLQLSHAAEAIEDAETLLGQTEEKGVPADILWRARFVRAAARYQLRLYADARADILTLLKEKPENENARILEALTLQKMGQNNEALNRLNIIVASNPQSIDALTTRASVLAELDKPALARADYDALIELLPAESSYYIERARMLIRLGEKSAARADLDKAVSLGVPHGVVQALLNLTK